MPRKHPGSGALVSAIVLAACAPSDAYAPSDEPPIVASPEGFGVDVDDPVAWDDDEPSVTGPLRTPLGSVGDIDLGPSSATTFAAIDAEGDGIVNAAELEAGMWQLWDADGDGRLSRREWQGGWFEGQSQGSTFAQWDDDGDGFLSRSEFARTWTRIDLFEAWNTDGDTFVTAQEFEVALAETFDADEDFPPDFSQAR